MVWVFHKVSERTKLSNNDDSNSLLCPMKMKNFPMLMNTIGFDKKMLT